MAVAEAQTDDRWNPVADVRKKYPGLKDWSDDRILKNMEDPTKFKSAFPEYSHLSDDAIKRNVGKLRKKEEPVVAPATSATPHGLSEKELTTNTPDEQGHYRGLYEMTAPSGEKKSIPYNNVNTAIKQGYKLTETSQKTYLHDYSSDPNVIKDATKTAEKNADEVKLVVGATKELGDLSGGALHLAVHFGEGEQSPHDIFAYKKLHPHATDEEAEDAVQKGYRALKSELETKTEEWADSTAKKLQSGGSPEGIWENIGSLGTQVGEIAIPEGWLGKLAEGSKVAETVRASTKMREISEFLGKYPRIKALVSFGAKTAGAGAKGAAEQGAQTYVETGGDAKQAEEAAMIGGGVGAVAHVGTEAIKTGAGIAKKAVRGIVGTGESQSAEMVRDTAKSNKAEIADAEKKTADNQAKYELDVQATKDENARLEQEARDKTSKRNEKAEGRHKRILTKQEEEHQAKVDEIAAQNTKAEQEASQKTAEAQQTAKDEYERTVTESKDLESKRGRLARQEITLRDRLSRRLQDIKTKAKAYTDGQWDAIRKAVGKATTPIEPLIETVDRAKSKFEGSKEKVREFEDILARAQHDGATDDLLEATARSNFGKPYIKLETIQKATVDRAVKEAEENYARARGETIENATIDYTHLRGYSSELGKLLRTDALGRNVNNLDADVIHALSIVKNKVDGMVDEMANDAGMGAKLKKAKADYRTYKQVFYEPTGMSKSGSPVAQGLGAVEAFNSTQPFLSDQPEVASRMRQMLVGRESGPYYDPNAGKLLDQLRAVADERKSLPKPGKTPEYAEPKPVEAKTKEPPKPPKPPEYIPPEPVEPKLKPEPKPPEPTKPELKKLSPEKLREQREENIYQFAKKLQHFGPYMATGAVGGFIGGLSSLATGNKDIPKAIETGAVAGSALLLAPYAIRTLLEKPWVIEKLTKPTLQDLKQLEKLPRDQREGVEVALAQLSKEAEKRGIIKKPSRWMVVLASEGAKKLAQGEESKPTPGEDEEQKK
jgi:hypothetical protein